MSYIYITHTSITLCSIHSMYFQADQEKRKPWLGSSEQQQRPRQAQLDRLDIDRVFEVFGVSVGQDRRQTGNGHLENYIQCAQQLPA